MKGLDKDTRQQLFGYALRMGDSCMVLSQRYCEQVGNAPILEEELALGNIGLDVLGQTTAWLELAAELGGKGSQADDLVYLRNDREYTNYLLVELENGDFAQIILRGYLFSSFLYELYLQMKSSSINEIAAIAEKSVKEVKYHLRHLGDWLERLGHGTEESHQRLSDALDYLWPYTGEMFNQDEVEQTLTGKGFVPDKTLVQQDWLQRVSQCLQAAGLDVPNCEYFYSGGTEGKHTEYLGFLLAEMQSIVRAHPGAKW